MVIEVADVVAIAPSVTVQAAPVKPFGFAGANVVPSSLIGAPVSSSLSWIVSRKSSRLENCRWRTGVMYMPGSQLHIPSAKHERRHHVHRLGGAEVADRAGGGDDRVSGRATTELARVSDRAAWIGHHAVACGPQEVCLG